MKNRFKSCLLDFNKKLLLHRNFFLTRTIALLILVFLICWAVYLPNFVEGTDFSAVVYTSARMVKEGKVSELYLADNSEHFPFNDNAHKWLTHMSKDSITIFIYPPLLAFITQPLANFSPQQAFQIWQICSILSLLLCSLLISSLSKKMSWESCFSLSLLYAPIFHLLVEGQTDLIIVLLPLTIGYFFFIRNQPFLTGLFWSILLLKPQFIAVVFVFIISYALTGKWKSCAGFMLGTLGIITGNIICFGPKIAQAWLTSLHQRMILQDYIVPKSLFLMSSLPMVLFERLPHNLSPALQGLIYIFIGSILIHAILSCRQFIKKVKNENISAPLVLILAISILPLTSRHLYFYDLSIFALVALIIFGDSLLRLNKTLTKNIFIAWALIDLYLLCILVKGSPAQSIILVTIFIWFYIRLLQSFKTISNSMIEQANANL